VFRGLGSKRIACGNCVVAGVRSQLQGLVILLHLLDSHDITAVPIFRLLQSPRSTRSTVGIVRAPVCDSGDGALRRSAPKLPLAAIAG
jgi:hypothetical protein